MTLRPLLLLLPATGLSATAKVVEKAGAVDLGGALGGALGLVMAPASAPWRIAQAVPAGVPQIQAESQTTSPQPQSLPLLRPPRPLLPKDPKGHSSPVRPRSQRPVSVVAVETFSTAPPWPTAAAAAATVAEAVVAVVAVAVAAAVPAAAGSQPGRGHRPRGCPPWLAQTPTSRPAPVHRRHPHCRCWRPHRRRRCQLRRQQGHRGPPLLGAPAPAPSPCPAAALGTESPRPKTRPTGWVAPLAGRTPWSARRPPGPGWAARVPRRQALLVAAPAAAGRAKRRARPEW